MAIVKREKKFDFPGGPVWITTDNEWGIEIFGQEGAGLASSLISILSWDFDNPEMLDRWTDICEKHISELHQSALKREIIDLEVLEGIFLLETMIESYPEIKRVIKEE